MSIIELILYTFVFAGVTVGIGIPAMKWYKLNVGMDLKKKLSVIVIIAVILVAIASVISSFL